MATIVKSMSGCTSAELVHPQVRRLNKAGVLAQQQLPFEQGKLKPNGNGLVADSHPASQSSTPVPQDAPPSVVATSSARKALRAQHKASRRLFPTVDYEARVSHFDPQSEYRDFRGFFVLFWVGLAVMVITTMLRNVRETGYPFQLRQRDLFLANIYELAISDLIMTASTMVDLPLHWLYVKSTGSLRWHRGGKWVQGAYQTAWLLYWVNWPFIRSWSWTAQVCFTLHLLTLLMKMHSWAFYNGHLARTRERLNELDKPHGISREAAVKYPTTGGRVHSISVDDAEQEEDSDSGSAHELQQLREDLAVELTSPLGHVTYPQNLTISNFVDFLCCPTLCYELEYPRTERIRWGELASKTLAIFGCIFLMTIVSEEFVMPVLDESAVRLQNRKGMMDFFLILAETISWLLFPFMVTFLLVFLTIFEYLCGAFAEMTCFADRHFYSDWWNSCDWLEFSREWNIPVHNFCHRHIYAALSYKNELGKRPVSRSTATLITFLISAVAHELVMGCITKKLRGYGAIAMMLQMPIVAVQRSKWIRGQALLNNVLFWCSMILGLAMMCALYVLV